MKDKIIATLQEIAARHHIEILYACESGSRAWGFPSIDSDCDVRFIYMRKLNDYLSVQTIPDQFNFPINEELDINGWDLKKVLQLLYKSNSTPFEWLQSPVVYQERAGFSADLMELLPGYFNARYQVYHYLGIAKGAMEAISGGEVKVKKMFYIIRPVLAAKWIVDKNEYPPMDIQSLLEVAPKEIQAIVQQMIADKSAGMESDKLQPDERLLNFIYQSMEMMAGKTFRQDHFTIDKLNLFFQKMIQ